MRKFLCCRDNFAEKQAWQKYCWVNIEMPTEEDTLYLTRDLKIPSAFLSDIRDVDERPRICLLYTSPSPRDAHESRMPSSA